MKIPTTLTIASRTWRVKYTRLPKHILGNTSFSRAVIELAPKLRSKRNQQLREHTFMHELLHATSGTMGWQRVNTDEDRIDALATLLVQAFTTQRGAL